MSDLVRYAGFWRRVGAALTDLLLWVPVMVVLFRLDTLSATGAILSAILGQSLYYAYVLPMTKRFGGTLGKLAMGIRVTPVDGGALSWSHVLRRSAVDALASVTTVAAVIIGINNVPFEAYQAASWAERSQVLEKAVPWYPWTTNAYLLWLLSEFVVILLNRRRRALHDFIAGTAVVITRKAPGPAVSS